jgi:methylmalonyl-CoA mutase N-terminal domain/subunit
LPSEEAVTIALRTQQIIAHESGVPATADPLGGSYFVEQLTTQVEQSARDYIDRIDQMGGMIAAIERGFPQAEIANASYEYQRSIETGDRLIVGVNAFTQQEDQKINLLQLDEKPQEQQVAKLKALRAGRDNAAVERSLSELRRAATGHDNTMPYILGAVRAYATLGEICDALRDVFGTYQESSIL